MKSKYKRMNKQDRKIVRDAYNKASEKNANVSKHLKRSIIINTFGIVYAIGLILYSLISGTGLWWEYVSYSFILILCLVLWLRATDLYEGLLNKFVINNKKELAKKIKDFEKI